jgi:hypothetical protein
VTNQALIEQSIDQSFQTAPKAEQGAYLLHWLVRAGLNVHPWWSPSRDVDLRNFWKTSDHVSGTLYTLQSKMTSIPFKVLARDPSNKDHVAKSDLEVAGWGGLGRGWVAFFAGGWISGRPG